MSRRAGRGALRLDLALGVATFAAAAFARWLATRRSGPPDAARVRAIEAAADWIVRLEGAPREALAAREVDRGLGAARAFGHVTLLVAGYLDAAARRLAPTLEVATRVQLGAVLLGALGPALVFAAARAFVGRPAALAFAALALAVPFGAASPSQGVSLALALAAWGLVLAPASHALGRRSRWACAATALLAGVAVGVAPAAVGVVAALPLLDLAASPGRVARDASRGRWAAPVVWLVALAGGPLAFVATNPWMWPDVRARAGELVVGAIMPVVAPDGPLAARTWLLAATIVVLVGPAFSVSLRRALPRRTPDAGGP